MSIRNLQPGAPRLDVARAGAAPDAQQSDAGVPTSRKASSEAPPPAQDRVELSEAARAHTAPEADPHAGELEHAREALLGIPPLDAGRKEDILLRVQEGYYSSPDVLKQIAQKLSADFGGGQPPEIR